MTRAIMRTATAAKETGYAPPGSPGRSRPGAGSAATRRARRRTSSPLSTDPAMHTNAASSVPTSGVGRESGIVYWCCLLLLCSAYLQGGLAKAWDFPAALAEMRHFGLAPAAPFALLAIVGELGASLMVLAGRWRWAGAVYLALFTFAANLVANRFWALEGMARTMSENGFFEHLGLVGAFLIVAWVDLRGPRILRAGHAGPGRALGRPRKPGATGSA
jgi:uncharacterized membrane protein YphA (DoxX/SURF4 family)